NTLYHFRVNGANCAGTVNGSDLTFTTPCTTATATVNTPTGVAATSATLRGSVNANNVSTTVLFEYGIDTNYGSSVAASPVTVTGSSVTPVTAVISGLTPNATYHYRVKTATCGGASYSSDQAFSTICAAPTASTAAATAIGISGATFNGSVNPNYGNATVTFDYGTTTSYGLSATAAQSPVTGNTPTAVSATVTTLAQGTTYHYRTRVLTCYGTPILGSDQVFQTLCNAPTATTSPANVTDPVAGRAVLYGVVNGGGNSTTVQFEYGTSTAYGTTVYGSPSSVSGSSNTAVSATITGLTEGTVYYFRVKATSCYGTVYGASERFVLDINGNLYHIVSYLVRSKLGGYITYTWMKENLRATSYSDLTPVPPGCDTCTMYSISYKPYGGISSNADVYGMLYNGVTVNSPKNICPTGWHVPTYSEWTSLINYAGTTTAAGKLKEVGNVHWYSPNTGAEDFIGFSARGGGYATSSASYGLNTYGYWWADGTLQYIRLIYNDATVVSNTVSEDYYFSIRCKK
ncbi:MAG TPA: fibrobacter succinogenes major paralogous domain-containing protein, partial [Bacteroidales bacterium]|nr:fibrobacter succinogenes major paralogous domain-containing protein [Bacteroidales bacterium]